MTVPSTISIVDAARALNSFTGVVQDLVGVRLITGRETFPVAKLVKALKCPLPVLGEFLNGHDKALTKQEAADALGVNVHCLHRPRQFRATVLPVIDLGRGTGRGWRYSFNAVQAQIVTERLHPRPKMGVRRQKAAATVAST